MKRLFYDTQSFINSLIYYSHISCLLLNVPIILLPFTNAILSPLHFVGFGLFTGKLQIFNVFINLCNFLFLINYSLGKPHGSPDTGPYNQQVVIILPLLFPIFKFVAIT